MLSEQRLRELEVALDDLGRTTGRAEDFRQLIAAARVANASARVDREARDGGKRAHRVNGNLIPADAGIDRADWNLARALARYTQP